MKVRGRHWSDVIDACYCISLQSRPDRYERATQELKRVGLHEMTYYLRPKKHRLGGEVGCWLSHRRCMQIARRKKQCYILILEDDIQFLPTLNLNELATQVNIFKSWPCTQTDILYLGHVPLFMSSTPSANLFKTKSLTTHAYIVNVNGSFCQQCIQSSTFQHAIDIFAMLCAKTFAIYPMVAIQKDDAKTDIQNKPVFIQRFAETQLWPRVSWLENIMIVHPYHCLTLVVLGCIIWRLVFSHYRQKK
jgi:hypothetical protein